MEKKLLSILLLLSSCASTQTNDIIIHDIDVDFPAADTVAMKYKQTFDAISYPTEIAVKDTIFFTMNPTSDNISSLTLHNKNICKNLYIKINSCRYFKKF